MDTCFCEYSEYSRYITLFIIFHYIHHIHYIEMKPSPKKTGARQAVFFKGRLMFGFISERMPEDIANIVNIVEYSEYSGV